MTQPLAPSTSSPPAWTPSLARAAHALRVQFFLAGLMFATWGVHVPTVKAHYGLGEQGLGLAMLTAGLGALGALSLAGRVIGRWGPRTVAAVTGGLCALVVGSLLLPGQVPGLVALLVVYGAAGSLFDVALNAEATEIEARGGRTLMSGFHGMFSVGGMVGAGVGSLLPVLGWTPAGHLAGSTLVGLALVALSWPHMLPLPPQAGGDEGAPADADAAPRLGLPRGRLALIGLLAALGLISEGAMYDWSVLFLKQERGAGLSLAALGYAAFSAAMALGRFGGDALRARWRPATLVQASGGLAALGMTLALLWPHPLAGVAGFTLVGLGLSGVVPVLFSAAAQVPGVSAAHGIAAVSSVAYLGMMAGPPLIGLVAQQRSLTQGLLTVVLYASVMALAANRALGPIGRPGQAPDR